MENTKRTLGYLPDDEDHLHIRGEYPKNRCTCINKRGSPPHTWRIHIMQSSFAMSIGITSTYVENTTVQQDTTAVCQDHLHIRGEYDTDTDKERVYLGSPPHTWRIRKDNPFSYRLIGITSTYVENTLHTGSLPDPLLGSPPHTWRILIHKIPQ